MTTLAAQIAIALENARLYEEIERQERRLERDLSLARELQGRLLPQTNPKMAHLDVAAKFVPARTIGGDLYDFIPYSMSRLGIVIGDVSGKGAPAAIYAALVSGIIRSHAPIEPAPARDAFCGESLIGRTAHRGPVRFHHLCGVGRCTSYVHSLEFRTASPDLSSTAERTR